MGKGPGHDETMMLPGAVPTPPGAPAQATAPHGGRLPADALPQGTTVGEYVVERMLGEGGMGQVYAAVQPIIGKRVAIKVLKAGLSEDPELVRRFVGEARAVNKIGHPNIIDIFSFGQLPDGRQYFVMEFLEGETLSQRIEREPLTADDARRLLMQACQALEAAHREKIVHRDLKPDNLWVAKPKHGDPFLKVLDFGIAKLMETELLSVTRTGVTMGTPMYMSPEQCLGQNVDHRTDIYAMGVMLYQIFAGCLPFNGHTFAELIAQQLTTTPLAPSTHRPMPAALDRLILECLEKDPGARPQTAAELAVRLDMALNDKAPPPVAQLAASSTTPVPAETRQGFAGHKQSNRAGTALPARPQRESSASAEHEPAEVPQPHSRRALVMVLAGLAVAAVVTTVMIAGGSHKGGSAARSTAGTGPASSAAPPAVPTPPPAATPPPSPAAAAPPAAATAPATKPAEPAATAETPTIPRKRSVQKAAPANGNEPRPAPRRTRVDDRGIVKDNPY